MRRWSSRAAATWPAERRADFRAATTFGGAAQAPGNPTFDVQSPATGTGSTALSLAALSDQGIAPRTITFQNSGTSSVNSSVTLTATAASLVDGTIVNVSNGSAAGVNLILNGANALGTLAQVTVNGNSTLTLGAAEQFGSLGGSGAVAIGAQVLTIGNTANSGVYTTNLSGALTGTTGSLLFNAGTLTLSGAGSNVFTGGTTVNGGTLILAKTAGAIAIPGNLTISTGMVQDSGAGGQVTNTATLAIGNGGTWNLDGFNETVSAISALSGSTIGGTGGTLSLSGASSVIPVTGLNMISAGLQLTTTGGGAATRTFNVTNSTDVLKLSGGVSEGASASGGLTKTGNGTLILSGLGSYTGATTINRGTVIADLTANGGAGAIGATSNLTLNGGQLLVNNASGQVGNQALGTLNVGAGTANIITINDNSGVGTTVTFSGGAWTAGVGSTVLLDYSQSTAGGGFMVGSIPTGSGGATGTNHVLGYALVKNPAGNVGIASINNSNQIVALSGPALQTLQNNTNNPNGDYTTNGVTGGSLLWSNGITNRSVDSLTLDGTTSPGLVVDMGPASNVLTLTSGALEFVGGSNVTSSPAARSVRPLPRLISIARVPALIPWAARWPVRAVWCRSIPARSFSPAIAPLPVRSISTAASWKPGPPL